MATNFPTGLDTPTNPTSTDYLDTVGVLHATLHTNTQDAIKALEAKVGIDSSAVVTSLDYKLTTHLAAADPHTQYQRELEKNVANGYPGLDASSLVAASQIPDLPESRITNLVTDLGLKALDSAVVHNSGNETIAGVKTYSAVPLVPAGTNLLPSLTFSTDTDTGLYSVGANQLGITIGGTLTATWGASSITYVDAVNMVFSTGTGTKIGTGTTQKIGFWNATPVVKPSAYTQTYATADKTLATLTATALTNANGTGDGTIADVGVAFSQATLNNNFRDVSNALNALIVDHADLAQIVNSLIDDLQAMGLVA